YKAPVVVQAVTPAIPEPEADDFFYPINNSSFASRNNSVEPPANLNKHASSMSSELDRTFACDDDQSLNNLKKYDDVYEDQPYDHTNKFRHRNSGSSQNHDMPVPQTYANYNGSGRPDEFNEKQAMMDRTDEKKKGPYPDNSPYVGRWAKMSRAWASQTIVMLLLSAFTFFTMALDARETAEDILLRVQSACLSLESATDIVINSPRSVGISTLTLVQNTAQSIIDVTGRGFVKTLSILQTLIGWVLRMYLGTYVCIAEVIIRTALSIAEDVSNLLTQALQVAVNAVVGNLQNVAATIAGGVQNGINDIAGFFGGNKNTPAVNFNIADIRQQLTITIPTDWINNIGGLADKIPTQQQLFGDIDNLLSVPFNMLSNAINTTFSNTHVNIVNNTHFPDEKYSDMCSVPLGKQTIDELTLAIQWIMYIAAFAFLGAALVLLSWEIYSINRRENKFQTRLADFRYELVEYQAPMTRQQVGRMPLASGQAKGMPSATGLAKWMPSASGLAKWNPLTKEQAKWNPLTKDQAKWTPSTTGQVRETSLTREQAEWMPATREQAEWMSATSEQIRAMPLTKEQIKATPATRQELDFFVLPGRPWFHRITNIVTKKYGHSEKVTVWRWYLDYIWHPPSLACFFVGTMGLIAIYMQVVAIDGLRELYIPKLADDLNKFQGQFLGDTLLGGVRNDSIAFANNINNGIAGSEATLDRDL
ncbi:plasma membrane fusion protein prm1, partial [Coemansia aciculifera]